MQLFFNTNPLARLQEGIHVSLCEGTVWLYLKWFHLVICQQYILQACSMVCSYQRCEWHNSRSQSKFRQEVKQVLCSFVLALALTPACSYGRVDVMDLDWEIASVHFIQGFGCHCHIPSISSCSDPGGSKDIIKFTCAQSIIPNLVHTACVSQLCKNAYACSKNRRVNDFTICLALFKDLRSILVLPRSECCMHCSWIDRCCTANIASKKRSGCWPISLLTCRCYFADKYLFLPAEYYAIFKFPTSGTLTDCKAASFAELWQRLLLCPPKAWRPVQKGCPKPQQAAHVNAALPQRCRNHALHRTNGPSRQELF